MMTIGEVLELLKRIFENLSKILGDLFASQEGEAEDSTEA